MYFLWRRFKTILYREKYRLARNFVTAKIRKSKKRYFSKRLDSTLPPGILWKNLRDLNVCGKDENLCSVPPDELNNYFLNSVSHQQTDSVALTDLYVDPPASSQALFSFRCVSEVEVLLALHSIKSNAVGLDGLPLRFIKLIDFYIIPPLTHIINCCLTRTYFPTSWKLAVVAPIAKKQPAIDPEDYRPVSVLPCFSKVLEKIMNYQITEFVSRRNLLDEFQSGFRAHHSCTSALLKVTDDIRCAVDDNNLTVLTLLDFSKAFDSVNHRLLILKLKELFKFDKFSLKFIGSYLEGRQQMVRVNNALSSGRDVPSGVPQGSIMGPLLFSIFINDLPSSLRHCKYHMYADDVQVYL